MTGFSGKLPQQAWMVAPETQKLLQALLAEGGDARFVGGCVRNALANRKVIDIDIATPLLPDEVIARLQQHKIAHAPIGLKHGTVTAIVDGHPFEITTLRVDEKTFGRHADVKFTDDWKKDAARRDFTINAIYVTPEGDIFDPFNGVVDLRLGRVRFVGDPHKRIHEDVLRILRFFRFYAHFGREAPDESSLKACTAAAKQIPKLSAERIRQEVLKLLEADKCADVWQLMLLAGVVTHFLPEATNVNALKNIVQLENAYDCPPFPLRRLAAVLDVTTHGLRNVIKGLKLSNEQSMQLHKMIDHGAKFPQKISEHDVKKYVYRLGNDMARNLLLLSAARSNNTHGLPELYHIATTFSAKLPLHGEDVLKIGIAPGPEVGMLLGLVEDWWIEEDFKPGRAACLERLKAEIL